MSYALQTLWHERQRYASGVFAVTFSAVLIALQCGLLLGLFKITSIPIDQTHADIWVGSKSVPSVDLGKPIPESYLTRVDGLSGVRTVELYIANFANFTKPTGGTELCFLLGSSMRSEEHTSELQSHVKLVCRLLHEKKTGRTRDAKLFCDLSR